MDAMLSTMTMSEYVHWQAYFGVEPFPEVRADLRVAEQLRIAVMVTGSKDVPSVQDLMPDWWEERRSAQQTPEQIKQNMQLIQAMTRKSKSNGS